MNFGIAQHYWKDFSSYAPFIGEIGTQLTSFLSEKSYGGPVKDITLGITMLDEQSKAFYKKKKLRFTKGKKEIMMEGVSFEIEDSLSYEIWLDEKMILDSKDKKGFQKYVCDEIVRSFDQLKEVKSIKGFDVEAIQRDVAKFLNQNFH